MRVGDAATALGLEASGRLELLVKGVAAPEEAAETDLALAMDPKYLNALKASPAKAAVVPPETDLAEFGLEAAIFAPRARFALAGVTKLFAPARDRLEGVHPSAVIDDTAEIAPGAAVGPLCVIGAGARVGAGAQLLSQCTIGDGASIGPDCLLHAGVRIGHGVRIGARCIIHQNAVVGSDGFSFVTPEPGSVESAKSIGVVSEGAENRVWVRITSLGSVEVADDVEIGAGAAIDRGTISDTRISAGVKIDNLVQIGHNVSVGENCLLCGHSGVAGSAKLGARVVLGGKAGVGDHAHLGDDVVVMAASGVSGAVKSRSVIGGTPAVAREELAKQILSLRRLPRALEDIATLKNRFSQDEPSG